jgi:hypothetical protein
MIAVSAVGLAWVVLLSEEAKLLLKSQDGGDVMREISNRIDTSSHIRGDASGRVEVSLQIPAVVIFPVRR